MDNGEINIELWKATRRGDRETVEEALANGADVNWKKVGISTFTAASYLCSYSMSTKELLKNY